MKTKTIKDIFADEKENIVYYFREVTITIKEDKILRQGLLTETFRIDPDCLPDGWYVYPIRHSDSNWARPVTLEDRVLANYYGCFITKEKIDFKYHESDNYVVIKRIRNRKRNTCLKELYEAMMTNNEIKGE